MMPGRSGQSSYAHTKPATLEKARIYSLRTCISLVLSVHATIIGCGQMSPQASDPLQLTEKNFACNEYTASEINERLKGMPQNFINTQSFQVGTVEQVRNQLTGIPEPMMTYLFDVHRQNGLSISEAPLGNTTIGETLLIGPRRDMMVPTRIRITNRQEAVFFALQHEVGHAVEGFVNRSKQVDPQTWQRAFQEGRSNGKLRTYARSSPGEYFAEAFANFYCSQAAHDFLKAELPQTYGHLKNTLPPPKWEEPGSRRTNDLYVLIDDENPEEIYLYLSLPEDVTSIRSCKTPKTANGGAGTCPQDARNEVAFEKIESPVKGRVIMKSTSPIDRSAHSELTFMGANLKGETVQSRSLSFI